MIRLATGWGYSEKLIHDYEQIKNLKSHEEKDKLFRDIASSLSIGISSDTSLAESCMEILSVWKRSTKEKESDIIVLSKELSNLPGVDDVRFMPSDPDQLIDIIIIGNRDDLNLYDEISEALVRFEDSKHIPTSYLLLSPEEFEASGLNQKAIRP